MAAKNTSTSKREQLFWTLFFICAITVNAMASAFGRSTPLIINHTCTDISQIPQQWIEAAKANFRIHYGHTSHGSQITTGLERNNSQLGALYNVALAWSLPTEANSLNIMDRGDNSPEMYYDSAQQYLDNNPTINVSLFGWCGQAAYSNWQEILNEYLTKMQAFEAANPQVTFIYMTGNAQEYGCAGCNRHSFNEQLRNFAIENNKILFDFADLDAWYNGDQNSYVSPQYCECAGNTIPLEHSHYNGDEAGHTTFESCENKGKAFWWLLARLAGWEDTVPVELTFLSARVENNSVYISWETASETNCYGYNIYRSENQTDNFKQINLDLIKCAGTSSACHQYSFRDDHILANRYYHYQLEQIDVDGTRTFTSPIEVFVDSFVPDEYQLLQNYPNPFNAETDIQYELPYHSRVSLIIFNTHGQQIRILFAGIQKPGSFAVKWNGKAETGKDMPSGTYIYGLKTDRFVAAKKMLLLR